MKQKDQLTCLLLSLQSAQFQARETEGICTMSPTSASTKQLQTTRHDYYYYCYYYPTSFITIIEQTAQYHINKLCLACCVGDS